MRALVVLVATVFAMFVLASGCGEDNAVVGGSCVAPYNACGQRCVDLTTDPQNCGACSHACLSSQVCIASTCRAPTDGTAGDARGDGASDDGSDIDGGPNCCGEDGSRRDGGDGSTTTDSGDTGTNETGINDTSTDTVAVDACTPPYNTPQHCGDCATVCSAPNNLCLVADGGFACGPQCTLPTIVCNNTCVDPTNDEFNCGGCGIFCPSFICVNRVCVGSQAGDIVVIGHDYNTSIPSTVPQARVLTNSVFLRPRPTLRVLAYERYADPTSRASVNAILQNYATSIGRTVSITLTSVDADIPSKLTTANFDVFLLYDQAQAPAATLGPLGASWAGTMTTYSKAGGVIVALDGAAGAASDMAALLTSSTLLNVTAQTALATSTQVVNNAPGDTVGSGVASPYRVTRNSARFATDPASATLTYVIFDQPDNQPVVVHRIVN